VKPQGLPVRSILSRMLFAASLALAGCAGVQPVAQLPHASRALAVSPAGIFLDHGFMVNPMSDAAIAKVVRWMRERSFSYQLQNVTALRPDGTMDPANYSQLAHWIAVSRATDPQQKIVVYVSGSLTLVNTKSAWANIARTCKLFVQKYGADGVNLDFEPYRPQAANYAGLFKAVRQAIGPRASLSLDYTADLRYTWSAADYQAISSSFDLVMPMLYDTTCKTRACYTTIIDRDLAFQYAHLGGHAQLYPLIAAYAKSRYHDPSVENVCVAMDEIAKLEAAKRLRYFSVGVWWYYGWNTAVDRLWQRCKPS
jgi:hypothetical protein